MSYLDIIFVIALVWGLYKGFLKGLIIQIASLLALVLGVYGAIMFSGLIEEGLSGTFQMDDKYLRVAAFAITFIGIVIAVHFLGKTLEKVVNMIALGLFNKILGAVFGLLRVALLLAALLFVLEVVEARISVIPQKEKTKSVLYGPLSEIIPTIAPDAKKMVRKTQKETLA